MPEQTKLERAAEEVRAADAAWDAALREYEEASNAYDYARDKFWAALTSWEVAGGNGDEWKAKP